MWASSGISVIQWLFQGWGDLVPALATFSASLNVNCCKVMLLGFFSFSPHAKQLVLLYGADCVALGANKSKIWLTCLTTPPWFVAFVFLLELTWHSRTVLKTIWTWMWTMGQRKHWFGFTSLGKAGLRFGIRLHGTMSRWLGDLVCESHDSPSSPGGASCWCACTTSRTAMMCW